MAGRLNCSPCPSDERRVTWPQAVRDRARLAMVPSDATKDGPGRAAVAAAPTGAVFVSHHWMRVLGWVVLQTGLGGSDTVYGDPKTASTVPWTAFR